MHPFIADRTAGELAHRIRAKRRFGLPLPARPAALRTWHCRRELTAAGTDVLVIWNRTAKTRFAVDAIGARRCIHWEHGAAWDAGRDAERREYLERVPLAIANSTAAARVLQLLWGYRGDVRVCRNALRPSLVPAEVAGKRYPRGPIQLGAAARMYPVKGLAIVLHAVARAAPHARRRVAAGGCGARVAAFAIVGRALGYRRARHVSWRRRRHGCVLLPHRLPAARADHGGVRARRDRSGRARLPRRRGERRRLARGRRAGA